MTTVSAGLEGGAGGVLAAFLRRPRYEVIPLAGIVEQVVEYVPPEVKLTVTASPSKGIEATLDLTEDLAGRGFEVVPHLSARLVDCNGRMWSRPQARRPASQAAGAKDGVAQRGAHLQMGDEARRAPRRRHQHPKGARPSGALDAPHSAVTVH